MGILSPILIPITALSIPLFAVLGRVIVQPIVKAVTQLAQIQAGGGHDAALAEQKAAKLEARLDGIERVLARLADDYEFRKALESPAPRPLQPPQATPPPPARL